MRSRWISKVGHSRAENSTTFAVRRTKQFQFSVHQFRNFLCSIERIMPYTHTFFSFVVISCLYVVLAWQQGDAEYNDDSLALVPANGWKENLEKRNTWWTKKSIHDDNLSNACSVEKCMLMLLDCLRRSENRTVLVQCKNAHVVCLASCFQRYKEKFMFNSVAMAS
ncbi:hypothetical protein AVEN_145112-2 [Araneus ventricosus]|uniref:Uncharacterized protein n=1 Tax=Araneus ventricosus TaxID=182803 RepID=A0A4Y2JHP4_ARAVE|nr:hypothetical protein AVEN_145112-2 [Araneus ventricosus]